MDTFVVDHFIERKDVYINQKKIDKTHSFIKYIQNNHTHGPKILDIGTGGGPYICGIKNEIPHAECFATDVTFDTLKIINTADVELACSSVYHLPYHDNSFDVIVFSNLLHHLVGDSKKGSVEQVHIALNEIKRIAKDDATICIFEEYVFFKYQSSILFWLTYCFAKLNLQWKFFHINNRVIVSFLTVEELKRILQLYNVGIKFEQIYDPYNSRNWQLRILKFIANLRFITIIGKVKK